MVGLFHETMTFHSISRNHHAPSKVVDLFLPLVYIVASIRNDQGDWNEYGKYHQSLQRNTRGRSKPESFWIRHIKTVIN